MLPSPIPEKEDMMAMPRSKVVIVHVTGPLAPYVTEVESSLEDCGYTPLTRVTPCAAPHHVLAVGRWSKPSAAPAPAAAPAPPVAPVSYTHLRAHETRHD